MNRVFQGLFATRGRATFFVGLLLLLIPTAPSAHESGIGPVALGFQERLGSLVPLELTFTGEDGKAVRLGDLVSKPTILVLAYYRCKNECNSLFTGLAAGLRGMAGSAGVDYQVVALSVNEAETPSDAAEKKAVAIAAVERPFSSGGWRFLVGKDEGIDALAEAIGFSYQRKGDDFDHPLGAVILSPKGKIVRYMNGVEFLPVDLNMSVMEASSGLVRPTIAKALRFCLSYDPKKKQYGFDVLRVGGTVVILLAAGLALSLVLGERKRRRRTGLKG